MKIWIDATTPAPEGYVWCKSTNETIDLIAKTSLAYDQEIVDLLPISAMDIYERNKLKNILFAHSIEIIDMHHDAKEMKSFGGNYINILYWLEDVGARFPVKIHIHSDHPMNPIGVQMIRHIIERNNWTEIIYPEDKSCDTCEYKYYEACDEICARCENHNGYVMKTSITNRDWLDSLSNKEYVDFLCSHEFDTLKRSFVQANLGLYEWMMKPAEKEIKRK